MDHGHDDDEESSSSFDGEADDFSNLSILNNVDSQCINDRTSRHSVLAMANGGVFSQNKCCSKPFSCLQWTLVSVLFVSLQLCVVFSICDTKEIERNDVSF